MKLTEKFLKRRKEIRVKTIGFRVDEIRLPNKKTALIVTSGEVMFNTLNTSLHLKALDAVIIDQSVFHSTTAVSPEGARVIEVESPPVKYDLIRMKDKYGREGKFYEGIDQMYNSENGAVRFSDPADRELLQKPFYDAQLALKRISNSYTDEDIQHIKEQDLMLVLSGSVHSKKGRVLYSTVDVIKTADYLNDLESHIINDLTLLFIKK